DEKLHGSSPRKRDRSHAGAYFLPLSAPGLAAAAGFAASLPAGALPAAASLPAGALSAPSAAGAPSPPPARPPPSAPPPPLPRLCARRRLLLDFVAGDGRHRKIAVENGGLDALRQLDGRDMDRASDLQPLEVELEIIRDGICRASDLDLVPHDVQHAASFEAR